MTLRAISILVVPLMVVVGCSSSNATAAGREPVVPVETTSIAMTSAPGDTSVSSAGQPKTGGPSTPTQPAIVDGSAAGGSATGGSASCDPSRRVTARSGVGAPLEDRTVALGLGDALTGIRGHATAVGDVNGDGYPDLFVGTFADRPVEEYRVRGADGPAVDRFGDGGGSVLLRNKGDLNFEDVTSAAGLPEDLAGLGVAAADLDRNTTPDLFVAGDNRLFMNDGGRFREVEGPFEWETLGDEDDTAGVSVGDVNADGWLDLVVGHHFNSTLDFDKKVPVRLYLNRGAESGGVTFEDVTSAAGLVAMPTKAPHVQIVDIDGDGHVDIVTTASANSGAYPALLLGRGVAEGGDVPAFGEPERLGSAQYWVAGAVVDADADGAPEIFLVEWEPDIGSIVVEAPAPSGQWVSVRVVDGTVGGVGTVVEAYGAGEIGDDDELVAAVPIVASTGYGSGAETSALIGVGERASVDLVVIAANNRGRIEVTDVPAGATVVLNGETISFDCN